VERGGLGMPFELGIARGDSSVWERVGFSKSEPIVMTVGSCAL